MKIGFISLVLFPLALGVSSGTFYEVSTPALKSDISSATDIDENIEIPVALLCFNETTETLRTSETVTGCSLWESSLGVGVIQRPENRPSALIPELRARFLAAKAAAKVDGISLVAVSGYRSLERQTFLFNQAVRKYGSKAKASQWVLPPDLSDHPWGMAIDVNYPNDPESTKWLEKNGYLYGLCRAYENEWWHFEGLSNPGAQCPPRLPNASATQAR